MYLASFRRIPSELFWTVESIGKLTLKPYLKYDIEFLRCTYQCVFLTPKTNKAPEHYPWWVFPLALILENYIHQIWRSHNTHCLRITKDLFKSSTKFVCSSCIFEFVRRTTPGKLVGIVKDGIIFCECAILLFQYFTQIRYTQRQTQPLLFFSLMLFRMKTIENFPHQYR